MDVVDAAGDSSDDVKPPASIQEATDIVESLVDMGYGTELARNTLQDCDGDLGSAAMALKDAGGGSSDDVSPPASIQEATDIVDSSQYAEGVVDTKPHPNSGSRDGFVERAVVVWGPSVWLPAVVETRLT